MQHQPRLDSIRALAVLAVLGFHATSILPGGWLGVDVFFVLSGYLITSILMAERERTGRIDLRRFYIRRALRLGPALVLTVVLCVPILAMFPGAETSFEPWQIIVGVLAYVGNWMQLLHPVSLGPLTHTWSLAIEEQFYLVWPLLLIAGLAAFRSRRKLATMTACAVLVLALLRAGLSGFHELAGLWFATTSRADALLIGAIVAFLAPTLARRTASWIFCGSGALLAVACLMHGEFSSFMMLGGLTVIAILASAFLASSAFTPLGRFLEWKPLRAIGQVSYGIYLYHYPVFFIANHAGLTGVTAYTVKFGLTAVLVLASWFLVERPVLGLKKRFEAKDLESAIP